ncbi:MAG: imidazoleglycerol-phosphate dehydratase HisB [Desulfobacterales bacterium]|nr:imidazoleglycerol-phosphate dehydratase HisB [Desulfobacterales bacterium]
MDLQRISNIKRKTKETDISIQLNIDGEGDYKINTGIPFFDHMLSLFSAHGFFDLSVDAKGDIEVDFHHTVEDIGIVLGEAFNSALGDRKGIVRYGYAVTPMDESLAYVALDLSNRPYLIYNIPPNIIPYGNFGIQLAKEFFKSFAIKSGMNLHINVSYGEDVHHVLEAIFKALGRALSQAVKFDERIKSILSTKGIL